MSADHGSRDRSLKVWRWDGRDPSSLSDIEIVVAVPSRKDVQAASVRLGLPKPGKPQPMRPHENGFDVAIAEPGHVFWMDSEVHDEWQREADLDAMRRRAEARHRPGGTPVRRP